MTVNINRHRRAIERLYTDTATISRYVQEKLPSGETRQVLQAIYTAQPCKLSQRALGTNGQTEAQNEVAYETKLFIAPELVIRQGDELTVSRAGVTWEYTAGEPFPPYPTHQEISLQRKARA